MTKKLEDYEWLCPQPFMNLYKNVFGRIQPCCVTKQESNWGGGEIDDYFKSDKLKQLRHEMLTTPGKEVASTCDVCLVQEQHGSESHRRTYLDYLKYGKPELKPQIEEYIETDMEKPFIKTMEWLAPSNYCNLRCHMCGSGNSSSIARENQEIGHPNFSILGNKSLYKDDDVATKDIKEFEDKVLDNLVELKLTGGETLAIKYNYDLLETTVNNFNSEEMDLKITTNGTLTPKFNGKDIFDYIPRFKSTLINVSIEGWADRNCYIRYPSKWEDIMKNVRKFAEMEKTKILFVSTVNSLSVGYLWEVAAGCEQFIEECPNKFHQFASGSLVWGDWEEYTVPAIPLELRDMYIENYYENPNPRYDRDFSKLVNFLEDMPFDEKVHLAMMKDVKDRDKYRGTCLLDLWPEWKPYYD
jgi:sulfatase maturation enzyme AslB (radical SAM superfamily)